MTLKELLDNYGTRSISLVIMRLANKADLPEADYAMVEQLAADLESALDESLPK